MIYNLKGKMVLDLNYLEVVNEISDDTEGIFEEDGKTSYYFEFRVSGYTYISPRYFCKCEANKERKLLIKAWQKQQQL